MAGPFTSAHVPKPFDCVIDGEGYRYYEALETLPYGLPRAEFGISPTFLPRTNVSGDYGDNQNDFWMVFAQNDWSLGEQQRYFRLSDDESVRRFWHGENTNASTPGEVTLRNEVASFTAAGTPLAATEAKAVIYFVTTTNLYRLNSDATVTDLGAHGAGAPRGPNCMAADEDNVYIGGATKLRKFDINTVAFSDFSATTPSSIVYHLNAIYGAHDGNFWRFDTAGVATAVFQWKDGDGDVWSGAGGIDLKTLGGDLLILQGKPPFGGAVLYAYDGVAPTEIARLPDNFEGLYLASLYGVAFIAGRFQQKRTSIEYLPAIYFFASGQLGLLWTADDWTTSTRFPTCAQFTNTLVFNDPTRAAMMAYNLDTGGIQTLFTYTDAGGTPVMGTSIERLLFSTGAGTTTYYFPGTAVASTGFVLSSLFDAESSLTKYFRAVRIDYDEGVDGDGGSVDVAYRLNDLDSSSYTSIQTGVVSGVEYPINQSARSISIKVTLNKGTSTKGPRLKRIYVRGAPLLDAYRRRVYVLDLTGVDGGGQIQRRDQERHHKDGHQMAVDLETVALAKTPVTIIDEFGSFTGVIDNEGFQVMLIRPQEYVGVVRVRET